MEVFKTALTAFLAFAQDKLRNSQWAIVGGVLIAAVGVVNPADIAVAAWKAGLVSAGPFIAYWMDRTLFPKGRPDELVDLGDDGNWEVGEAIVYAGACLRRALIMVAVTLALALAV